MHFADSKKSTKSRAGYATYFSCTTRSADTVVGRKGQERSNRAGYGRAAVMIHTELTVVRVSHLKLNTLKGGG